MAERHPSPDAFETWSQAQLSRRSFAAPHSIGYLKRLAVFLKCSARFMEEVAAAVVVKCFTPGEVVMAEGAENKSLWQVLRGSLEVHHQGHLLKSLCDGACFGEAQLLGFGHTAPDTVLARTHVEIAVLNRRAFAQVVNKYPTERSLIQNYVARNRHILRKSDRCSLRARTSQEPASSPQHPNAVPQAIKAKPRHGIGWPGTRGHNSVWPSLADWHWQLAQEPEGRRLHLWQLDFYSRASPDPLSSKASATVSSFSRSMEWSSTRPTSGTPSLAPPQAPYPELPAAVQRDPAALRARRFSRLGQRPRTTEGAPERDSFQGAGRGGWESAPVYSHPELSDVSPSVTEAIRTLSKGLFRSRWHCENMRSARDESSSTAGAHSATFSTLEEANVPVPPPRRLEVTLRGTFRVGDAEDGEAGADGQEDDRDLEETSRAPTRQEGIEETSEELLRERMGFGWSEQGAAPSGRSSVPAIRGGSASGAPSVCSTTDEGINLDELASAMLRQVKRILGHCSTGDGRVNTITSQSELSQTALEEASPQGNVSKTPRRRFASPPRSLCPSPTLWDQEESEPGFEVQLRLLTSRCGSSSAVAELTLDHLAGCQARGCICQPSLEEAEAWLLAYFGNRSVLRLAAKWPPVKVMVEPMTDG